MKIKRLVPDGVKLPFLYGTAYYSYVSDVRVCYPIPLNLFVSLGRGLYYWVAREKRESWLKLLEDIAFKRGYDRGYKLGYEESQEKGKGKEA